MSFDNNYSVLMEMLPKYLQEQGINPAKKFCCISPEHKDETPSMSIYKNKFIKCFGCGVVYTIFDAAAVLEGLPPKGHSQYYSENISALAKRYSISLPSYFQSRTVELYDYVIEYLKEIATPELAAERKLSIQEILDSYAPSEKYIPLQREEYPPFFRLHKNQFQPLSQFLYENGFTREDMNIAGIFSNFICSEDDNSFLMPLWKHSGVCAGFFKRDYSRQDYAHMNSPNNEIFQKENYLYGIHQTVTKEQKIFIVEGQKDALAVNLLNPSCIGLGVGCASFTESQLSQVITYAQDINQMVLAFDNENSGVNGMIRAVEMCIEKGIIPSIYIWNLKDPDEDLIAGNTIDLSKIVDGLDWYIDQFDLEDLRTLEHLVMILSKIELGIKRLNLTRKVAEALNIDMKILQRDVEEVVSRKINREEERVVLEFERAFDKIRRSPQEANNIIADVSSKIEIIKSRNVVYDNESLKMLFKSVTGSSQSKAHDDILFRPKGLRQLGEALNQDGIGWTTTGCLGLISGKPHTGKSLLILQSIVEALGSDPNTMVFLFSTDDSLDLLIPRLISAYIFNPAYKISYLHDPNIPPQVKSLREQALAVIGSWINSERLIAKDSSYTRSINKFFDLVKFYRDKYPNRKVFILNDNFHRNGDYSELDSNSRIDRLAGDIKEFAVCEKAAVWCSVENRKTSSFESDPILMNMSNDDIYGAGALIYYATIIFHTLNDFIMRGKDIEQCVWTHQTEQGETFPRVVLKIGKNKHAGENKSLAFNMYPKNSFFQEIDYDLAYGEAYMKAKELGYKK